MSERDSVHKEIERLQEEITNTRKKMVSLESKTRLHEDERKKLFCQVEMLKQEIEQSLYERDMALQEARELR